MTAETPKPESLEQQVAAWSATESEIIAKVKSTKGLTIAGYIDGDGNPNPKKGREVVHRNLMDLVKVRTGIEERRKELKAPIIALGNLVDSEAKRLTALSQPRENELAADRAAYDAEEKRIEAERLAAIEAEKRRLAEIEQARIQDIADQIVELGGRPNFAWLAVASESAVAELLASRTAEKAQREAEEAEAARLAQVRREQEEREAEARRIQCEAEEKELAETRERLRVEQARIKAENDAREAAFQADLAKLNAEREEHERKLAKEEAERQAEARRVREEAEAAAAKAAAENAAKEEAERIERERPDREKALAWLSSILDGIPEYPAIENADIRRSLVVVKSEIADLVRTAQIGGAK